jgi:hypothetical protein
MQGATDPPVLSIVSCFHGFSVVSEFPFYLLPRESAVVGYSIQDAAVARPNLSQELLPIRAKFCGALVYAPVLADYHIEEFHQNEFKVPQYRLP